MKFKNVLLYFINYSQNEYKATVKSTPNQKCIRFQFECYEAASINPVTAVIPSMACADVAESLPILEDTPLKPTFLGHFPTYEKVEKYFQHSRKTGLNAAVCKD